MRLIEQDEEGAIARWLSLVAHVEADLLPAGQGRLVKCLGDGMLLEFTEARAAASVAFAIQHASRRQNFGLPAEQQMLLRMGIETGDVIVEARDVYGRGVNLATRLASLAGPGEIVVSAQVRDQLTPVLDADVEDLGECFLKHVQQPVRAYRIGPPGPRTQIIAGFASADLRPTIAIIPFSARDTDADRQVLGDVLAEEIIRELSRSSELNVISRLSTSSFRWRQSSIAEISKHLNADYVLSGVYRVEARRIVLDVELAEARSAHIVWSQRLSDDISGILGGEQELIGRVVADIGRAVIAHELRRARSQALPTLKSYSLLMAASSLMHSTSREDFEEARRLLQTLIDRATRQSVAHASLAHWYILRVQQGWSSDQRRNSCIALESTQRALDADPSCSLALAIDGAVHTNLLKRLDVAEQRYDRALEANPNEPLAWLLKGCLHAFTDDGANAVRCTGMALKLSPLDPHRYYYNSLAATANLTAGRYADALDLARRSLRANRTHTSTLRVMAVAQWRLGQHDEARASVRRLLELEPDLTIGRYLRRTPGAAYKIGKQIADVLHEAGVPD